MLTAVVAVPPISTAQGQDMATAPSSAGTDCWVEFTTADASALPPAVSPAAADGQKRARLASLDMLRGLTMAVMLIVDYTGKCFPEIDHAPWDGLHLADFVMPFFLWVSGVSMSVSIRVREGELRAQVLARAAKRAVRLFLLGIVVQGGWYHLEEGMPVLNLDLSRLRWMGILQRIALAFLLLSTVEILCTPKQAAATSVAASAGAGTEQLLSPGSPERRRAGLHRASALLLMGRTRSWAAVVAAFALGTGLTYGIRPPASWSGCSPHLYRCTSVGTCSSQEDEDQLRHMGCSAVGYLDSMVLGIEHLYVRGSDAVSSKPTWGFDPEGLVTTCSAVVPMAFGLHSGLVWKHTREQRSVLLHWVLLGSVLTIVALILSIGVPFNKRLWSPSYSLLMSGLATLLYTGLFCAVDLAGLFPDKARRAARAVLAPLQWLGENCILFFIFSDCCGVLDWLLRSVTWGHPPGRTNIVAWFQDSVIMRWLHLGDSCAGLYEECRPAVMAFIWIELLVWVAVCGLLHRCGIFWKI